MLIELKMEKMGEAVLIGQPHPTEIVWIKTDAILSVFPHKGDPNKCDIFAIGLPPGITPVVHESPESLGERVNSHYKALASGEGMFIRTRCDRHEREGSAIQFHGSGGPALVTGLTSLGD